jgi:chromosome segregation ATPase
MQDNLQTINGELRTQLDALKSASASHEDAIQNHIKRYELLNTENENNKVQQETLTTGLLSSRVEIEKTKNELQTIRMELLDAQKLLKQKQDHCAQESIKVMELERLHDDYTRKSDERVEKVKTLARKGLEDLTKR